MSYIEATMHIWRAAREGRVNEVERLVSENLGQIDKCDVGGETPLHYAAKHNQLAVASWLLEKGANPNARTYPVSGERHGTTPLHEAILCGKSEPMVDLLLAHNARINTKMSDGSTALILAAEGGMLGVVKKLLAKGANIELSDQMGFTALGSSLVNGNMLIAQLLVASGADVNFRIKPESLTPLMLAASDKQLSVVRLLVSAGSDIQARDKQGNTALHHSVFGAAVQVTETVWSKKEKTVRKDNPQDSLEIVKFLVSNGISLNAADNDTFTALDWARKFRLQAIIELLEASGTAK